MDNIKKKSLESTRTTKTNPKLVIFPDSGVDLSSQTEFSSDRFISDHYESSDLHRVTAFLISDSIDLKDLQSFLQKYRNQNHTKPKRFDEVLYSPISFDNSNEVSYKYIEESVASSKPVGELFFFDYGVVVIWGLGINEEQIILKDVKSFAKGSFSPNNIEIESFKFCHNPELPARLVNDVINLKSGHHMIKLTISHALAQSVKLTYFEELVERTIVKTKDIPASLAVHGTIAMSRKCITKQIGELFIMRINVNLVSNVLDTPEIFWSEPLLCPLYKSVRLYLEISQRVEVLNQRCSVLSDLLDMLREHANHVHAEALEWIVIILISLEIFIGVFTVFIDLYYIKQAAL